MTTVGVSNDSNAKTRDAISRYDNAFIIDWESEATEHLSTYILADGLHPTPEGAAAYAQLIHDTINECVLNK
jgi:lysophospholipase L1-like esterase